MNFCIFLGIVFFSAHFVPAVERWPSWRGADQTGATEADGPHSLGQSLVWKTELPGRDCSTPIVWGKQIFITTEVEGKDGFIAYDWSGNELWCATTGTLEPGRGKCVGNGANSSPVTDGKTVFAYFKSGNFAVLNRDGKIFWESNLEKK